MRRDEKRNSLANQSVALDSTTTTLPTLITWPVDHARPLSASGWTKLVQAVLKHHTGVPLEAKGAPPGGGRCWFRAKVVALRQRSPPLHVRYTATLEGVTNRLALPEPVTAYLHADDVRRVV